MPGRRRRRANRWVVAGLILLVAVGAVTIVRTLTRSARQDARRASLRDDLRAGRAAVDSCRTAVAAQESAFQAFDRQVDSLRHAVRLYESADTAGVAADEYDSYIATFDRYNAAVPEWRARADSLRARSERCRALARRHNRLTDSVRDLIEAETPPP